MSSRRPYALVCGRWDPELIVVDLARALDQKGRGGTAAIVGRVRVTDDPAPEACPLPVNLVLDEQKNRIYVVNHGGRATLSEASAMPHGHRGTVGVLALDRAIAGDADALLGVIDLPVGGPVGCALGGDGHLLVTAGEGQGTEDGGCEILVINPDTAQIVRSISLRHGSTPCGHESPNPGFGAYPNPNAIAMSGRLGAIFVANGGSNDVSILPGTALSAAESRRISLSSGGFGLALSPDEKWIAVAEREDAASGVFGSTVALIESGTALRGDASPHIHHIRIGTDKDESPSRLTGVCFTPDSASLFVSGAASGTLSRIDVSSGRESARTHLGAMAAPRGVAVTPRGDLVAVAGGLRAGSRSGVLSLVCPKTMSVLGSVGEVGNEPYFLAITEH